MASGCEPGGTLAYNGPRCSSLSFRGSLGTACYRLATVSIQPPSVLGTPGVGQGLSPRQPTGPRGSVCLGAANSPATVVSRAVGGEARRFRVRGSALCRDW